MIHLGISFHIRFESRGMVCFVLTAVPDFHVVPFRSIAECKFQSNRYVEIIKSFRFQYIAILSLARNSEFSADRQMLIVGR